MVQVHLLVFFKKKKSYKYLWIEDFFRSLEKYLRNFPKSPEARKSSDIFETSSSLQELENLLVSPLMEVISIANINERIIQLFEFQKMSLVLVWIKKLYRSSLKIKTPFLKAQQNIYLQYIFVSHFFNHSNRLSIFLQSFNEVDDSLIIHPCEWTVHVLETVELELGLPKDDVNQPYFCPIYLKR